LISNQHNLNYTQIQQVNTMACSCPQDNLLTQAKYDKLKLQ